MTNELSWPHIPSLLLVTMETPVNQTQRSGNIHQGQSGGHRCLESKCANKILQSSEGEMGNLSQGSGVSFVLRTVTLSCLSPLG